MGWNSRRLKTEWPLIKNWLRTDVVRFLKGFWPHNWKDLPHAYVGLSVEANELFPYVKGHLESYWRPVVWTYIIWSLFVILGR